MTSSALAKFKRAANKVRRGSAMLKGVTAMMGLHSQVKSRSQAAAADRKRRAQFSFSEGTGSKYIWLRDPKDEYAVAKVVENRPDGTVAVEMGTSRQSKIVPRSDVAFQIFRPGLLRTSFDDMVKMEDVNEATILHNLRLRFLEDQIYTNIGESVGRVMNAAVARWVLVDIAGPVSTGGQARARDPVDECLFPCCSLLFVPLSLLPL